MLFKTVFNITSLFAVNLLCTACMFSNTTAAVDDDVKVAAPKAYKQITMARVGQNDAGTGLAVGTQLTSLTVQNSEGHDVDLAAYWSQKPALVVFYRGGWCPYCNSQVQELSQRFADFEQAGIQLVLMSVDKPDKAAMMDAQYDIPFPVLSDAELIAHSAFNVMMELDSVTLAKYKMFGIVPKQWSGEEHNTIAVPSAFVVNTQGLVKASHASKDYASRPSADQLLALARSVL